MADFKITKNKPFDGTFVVKSRNSTLPVTLDASDTGTITFSTLEKNPTAVLTKALTLGTLADGEMVLSLTAEETGLFTHLVGDREDGAKFLPNYRANLSIDTVQEGHIEAQIPEVIIVSEG